MFETIKKPINLYIFEMARYFFVIRNTGILRSIKCDHRRHAAEWGDSIVSHPLPRHRRRLQWCRP